MIKLADQSEADYVLWPIINDDDDDDDNDLEG